MTNPPLPPDNRSVARIYSDQADDVCSFCNTERDTTPRFITPSEYHDDGICLRYTSPVPLRTLTPGTVVLLPATRSLEVVHTVEHSTYYSGSLRILFRSGHVYNHSADSPIERVIPMNAPLPTTPPAVPLSTRERFLIHEALTRLDPDTLNDDPDTSPPTSGAELDALADRIRP